MEDDLQSAGLSRERVALFVGPRCLLRPDPPPLFRVTNTPPLELNKKHSTISLTYHTVPKTYLAVQDRELVSNPTNRSARNGQNTKSFSGHKLLTTARGWHGAFTPAHGISPVSYTHLTLPTILLV